MVETFDKNMRASGLPDKVKKCIENGEFKMKNAMKALAVLGDDEESVDEDKLIEIARLFEHGSPPGGCEYPSGPKNEREPED